MPETAQGVFDAFGLGEFLARDILGVQLVILAATAALFAFSLAMMVMASQSAGRARKARLDAEASLRSAQDVVVEARQLSAQIDRASSRLKSGPAGDMRAPTRVSARETTSEADVEFVEARAEAVSHRILDAAKESATVPHGILGRRRK
jgi:hypothetical protein